jgi:hypothetical protein
MNFYSLPLGINNLGLAIKNQSGDILSYVILSGQRERRISTFGVNSAPNQEILRRSAPQNDMFLEMSTEPINRR